MAVAVLTGSFRAPADAVIRFTDGVSNSDWTITEGDYWASLVEMLEEWSAVVSAAGLGTIDVVISTANHYLFVDPSASSWTVTWSHTGDGTAIRDALGATGATTSTSFPSYVPCSYVARYGAVQAERSETGYRRGHRVSIDGSQQTQHGRSPSEVEETPVGLTLWTAPPAGITYSSHDRIVECIDSIWDIEGHAEPFSVHLTGEDDDLSTADQWVLRFVAETISIRPTRVPRSRTDRLWSISIGSLIAEDVP